MHNQHVGLSQLLAEQHRTVLHEHATQVRRLWGAGWPRRRRRSRASHWWQLGSLAAAGHQPSAALVASAHSAEPVDDGTEIDMKVNKQDDVNLLAARLIRLVGEGRRA
jgi:hypothetical protein